METSQKTLKPYAVHVTFKAPAWDERDGLEVVVHGYSKSDAVKVARSKVRNDGHTGVLYFKAKLAGEP